MAVRRTVLEQVRGFDPDYSLYQEETDLCLRVRRAGCRVALCPNLEIAHAGQQSQADLSEYEKARNVFKGTILFLEKHYQSRELGSMVRFQHLGASAILALSRVFAGVRTTRSETIPAGMDAGET